MAKKQKTKGKKVQKKAKKPIKKRKVPRKTRRETLNKYLDLSQELFQEHAKGCKELGVKMDREMFYPAPLDSIGGIYINGILLQPGQSAFGITNPLKPNSEQTSPSLMEVQEKIYELEKTLPWHKRIWLKLKGWAV